MKNLINPLLIILVAVVLRLLPHPPNFAPIAGLALFGGAYLNKKYALILPLIALFASDLFIGFHSTMPFVYGSFLLSGLIGLGLQSKKSVPYYKLKAKNKKSKVAMVLGAEVQGLPPTILRRADKILEIPMRGKKE